MGDKIVCADRTFTGSDIKEGNCFIGSSLAGEELGIDTLEVTVVSLDARFFPLVAANSILLVDNGGYVLMARPRMDDLTQYVYGDPVYYYHDSRLIGKFFIASVRRVGPVNYRLSCVSGVGLLEHTKHYGGIYTGQALKDVAADIVGGTVECTVDAAYGDIPVYGWLPVAARRENLHQLLFQAGLALRKDTAGVIHITALSDAGPAAIPDSRMFLGGSVDYKSPATAVSVSEHAYIAYSGDEAVTLFSGEVAAEPLKSPKGKSLLGALVTFDAPMHDLSISGGEILELGVNYAVLARAPDVLLTGKTYTHTVRELVRDTELKQSAENVASATSATLVSMANAENVVERLRAYYGAARVVRNDIVVGDERPGDPVTFTDPFGDRVQGFIQSMDINLSGLLRAGVEFVQGYTPGIIGNYYSHVEVVTRPTSSTAFTWTVPPGCKGKIRAVLIGGGQGGQSGARGEDGTKGSGSSNGRGGKGGKAGHGGLGGNVYIITLNAVPGQVFSGAIGLGGFRGEGDQAEGAFGDDTTFGPYSSALGRTSGTGYANLFGGELYALPGGSGVDGGKGSGSDGVGPDITAPTGRVTHPGASGATKNSGSGSTAVGGSGGGAAAGNNGGVGEDGSIVYNPDATVFASGGKGGKGARGVGRSSATQPGCGGDGGHGGGGGGGGGAAKSEDGRAREWGGSGGEGGDYGYAGSGAPGCVIIYW